jgi:sarcosine oxidase subunit beta
MQTADVVIIGGGIVGASIAYHLTEAGCKNVLVVERETRLGLGSTGKSMGGVRAQFATDVNIRMSMYSILFLARFEEATGHPSGYKPHGYLFVATHPRHMDYLRANFDRQVALGLRDVRLVSRDDIVRILPQLRADDVIGGSLCASDGFVDPNSVMTGFMARAEERGATLWRGVEVTAIDAEHGQVTGIKTTRGPVSARAVVNAAGIWAPALARTAGVELPIEPLRRMLVPTEPFPGLPEKLPMIIDMTNGFHFRQEGVGLILAWNDPEETPGYRPDFDRTFIEKILTRAADRVPCFAELAVNPRRCWAGMYDMTPDHHSILGPDRQVRGYYHANGFSGHGVMHSPATGKIVSDLIFCGETSIIDANILHIDRFAENRAIEETAVL